MQDKGLGKLADCDYKIVLFPTSPHIVTHPPPHPYCFLLLMLARSPVIERAPSYAWWVRCCNMYNTTFDPSLCCACCCQIGATGGAVVYPESTTGLPLIAGQPQVCDMGTTAYEL
jgi:hypothetical protein